MRRNRSLALLGMVGLVATAITGCAQKESAAPAATAQTAAPTPANGGKIPVTTSSAEAKAEYIAGRELFEKLQITDSVAHYAKAVALDPNFATAELGLANSAPSGKEFFEHLNKAVALADKASNGEKLLILAAQAGVNNDAVKQKEDLIAVVAAYPDDERAHFNMGGFYFGQQDFPKAIEHYKKATEIAPTYSPAFNLLGYAYRQNGDYANAEKAFQTYVTLIPKDPNPYDSYAELLLRMGRFDDAIAQYRKALEIDPNFVNANQGIAMALLYAGKPGDATAELQAMLKRARTDGERRTALFALTVVDVDGGKTASALKDVDQQHAIAEKANDVPGMTFDLQLKANILLETGKYDQAGKLFEQAEKVVQTSNLSEEFKVNGRLTLHYNLCRVALAKKELPAATAQADEYRKGAAALKNPVLVKQGHELDGIVALAQKNYDKAIEELLQANDQNPYNLYRLCQAYQARGDAAKAKDYCARAADSNTLPQINLAFVRAKAKAAGAKS